ncbi:MAG TPA: GNAT family N-acetyltransferase [Bdellovibrio sp.]|uniref:GNAT family N-acetyltransferase n=1 Tax=Bdellovibrio sp. TaxID=28201 RepID=UPI002F12C172
MIIREFELKDITAVKKFTDEAIGLNYYSEDELRECHQKSISNDVLCSFVLVADDGEILGLRLAYPPGKWNKGKGSRLREDLWNIPLEKTAYFQSLFLSNKVQGQGWGPRLSEKSIEAFRKVGARGIVTHAWKESPNNSSIRYLSKLGFQSVATHPEYWIDVDYECVRDGNPCRCTAEEMILYI